MKKVLLIAAASVMAFFLVRLLVLALASDETKIRWMVAGMEEGYNVANSGDTIGPLARDWSHEDYAVDRQTIHGAMVRDYMQGSRDPETRELTRRVDLDMETFMVEVDGDSAHFTVEARFSRLVEGAWQEKWLMRAEAELRQGEDGWKIHRTRHDDLAGTQLSR